MEACPADMICNLVISHINKKYHDRLKENGRKSACWKQQCTNELSRIYNYVAKQSKERFLYLVKKSEENSNDGKHFDNLLRFIYEYIVELKQYTYLESVATEYIVYSEKCIKNCYSKRTKNETYIRNGIKIKIAYFLTEFKISHYVTLDNSLKKCRFL